MINARSAPLVSSEKFIRLLRQLIICLCCLIHCTTTVNASESVTLDILGEEFNLQHFPANGTQLVIGVAPGYGFNERNTEFAKQLSKNKIEVWLVDLAENLFLPEGNQSIRKTDGRYIAEIIQQAHKKTQKKITLLTSSFGAIPVLRGTRQWQVNNKAIQKAYLNGAILFSPELYHSIPPLGMDPEFEPIATASNIPIMIYQSEFRNNRWQLAKVVEKLESGGSVVYQKIIRNITSFFYVNDTSPNTLRSLSSIPLEIPRTIRMLEKTPTPASPATLSRRPNLKRQGIDIKLKPYKGHSSPLAINLFSSYGEQFVRNSYKNKITVINFWATWCPPCVKEIPALNRLKKKMKGYDFELISINYPEDKKVIQGFLKDVNVEFPVLLDEKGRTSANWNVITLPSTYVIGPDGEFRYAVNAAIEWDSDEVVNALKKLKSR